MKLPGEEEAGGGVGSSLIYMVIGVSAFVLIVLFAVFRSNDNKRGGSEYLQQVQEQKEEEVKQEEMAAASDARKSLIGSGDRSEKIRTYNFPQDRITDHRVHYSRSNIGAAMDGEIDDIIKELTLAERKLGE